MGLYREIGDEHAWPTMGSPTPTLARQRREYTRAGDLYRQTCARFEVRATATACPEPERHGRRARLQGDLALAAGHYRRALTILDGPALGGRHLFPASTLP